MLKITEHVDEFNTHITYAEGADGLRAVWRDGQFIGWYNPCLDREV